MASLSTEDNKKAPGKIPGALTGFISGDFF
jgi:hypothetical protein